ncbi:FAD-binding protein [Amycolatopsis sp. GA6-003]|uniref:FAD-binding protein n=1 Tax=Amycolatopsis sp. GA6-003 TaxID=2652444 RepID=UPI003916FE34
MVEGADRLGGTSAYSGAACWLPGTQVQQRFGVADSTAAARENLRALLGEDRAGRQEAFLEKAPELVATLRADPALEFERRAFPDCFDRPGRVPGGRSFVPVGLPRSELGERAELVPAPATDGGTRTSPCHTTRGAVRWQRTRRGGSPRTSCPTAGRAAAVPGGRPDDRSAADTWVQADTLAELAKLIDAPEPPETVAGSILSPRPGTTRDSAGARTNTRGMPRIRCRFR